MISFEIPIKTTYTLNSRMHWSKRQRIRKGERNAVKLALPVFKVPPLVRILLTRVGPRAMDDDNVPGALKGIRDGLADRLGIDDGSPLIKWEYAQEKRGNEYAVRVEIGPLLTFGGIQDSGIWEQQGPPPRQAISLGRLFELCSQAQGTQRCPGCDDVTCRACGGALTSPDALRELTLKKHRAAIDSGEVTPVERRRK